MSTEADARPISSAASDISHYILQESEYPVKKGHISTKEISQQLLNTTLMQN